MKKLLVGALLLSLSLSAWAKPVKFEEHNQRTSQAADRGESWAQSALQVALKLVGDSQECRERRIEIQSTPEAFRDAHIVIIEEGLMDDSVFGIRYELMLRLGKHGWMVESADKTWKCWPGRGHQYYSDEPCL